MKCPHCGKTIVRDKAKTSANNGANWQKPHMKKVEHFLSLGILDGLESNEHKFKVTLKDGTTYNPDFFHPKSYFYIEVATSKPNISEQRSKWKRAMKIINLRVFWWEGEEITDRLKLGGRPRNQSAESKKEK